MKTAMTAAPIALEMPSSRRWLDALNAWFREASLRAAAEVATPAFPTTAEARALGEKARAAALQR